MREVKAGEYYRHFKGGLYQVTGIAKDAGTERPVVVYQALYGEEELWVRDYEEFVSEVDRAKYPDAEQQYRFEKIEEPGQAGTVSVLGGVRGRSAAGKHCRVAGYCSRKGKHKGKIQTGAELSEDHGAL